MEQRNRIYQNISEPVGQSPLVKLRGITKEVKGNDFSKLEFFYSSHSQKDKIALHIIENAERKGVLKKGTALEEMTLENTGVSSAMIALLKGYQYVLTISDSASQNTINLLLAMGAEVLLCRVEVALEDPKPYEEVFKTFPNSVSVNPYLNTLNSEARYKISGPEIWGQIMGIIDSDIQRIVLN